MKAATQDRMTTFDSPMVPNKMKEVAMLDGEKGIAHNFRKFRFIGPTVFLHILVLLLHSSF